MKKIFFTIIFTITFFYFLTGCINNDISNNNSIDNPSEDTTENELISSNSDSPLPESIDNNTNPPINSEVPTNDCLNTSYTLESLCRLYFFDSVNLKLYYLDKNISVENNALVTALTSQLQTNAYSNNFIILTNKVGIKSANLDKEKSLLTIQFNDSFTKFMNLGTSTESGLLNALVNTYGYNYGVENVAIFFGDELYTSLKGELPEGYFTVDYSNAIPFDSSYDTTSNSANSYNGNDSTVNKNCRIFYYSIIDNCYYYTDQQLTIIDKAVVTTLTNALKNSPDINLLSIPLTVSVRSAKLNSEDGILTVDLNKSYYDILQTVGSSGEAGALRSLAYTYGNYYRVSKIIITVDGKSYSGSHLLYEDDEYITIDSTQAVPYK